MTKLLDLGLGSVFTTAEEVVVQYSGNMGSTVERNIAPRFEEKFGLGTWDQVVANASKIEGNADYYYRLHISKKKFEKIVY